MGRNTDPELVVIIPALEGEPGMDEAGPLPVAPDPHNPDANNLFLHHLHGQGQRIGQWAMGANISL